MHLVPHLERFGDGRECRRDLAWRDLEVFEGELRAHQELSELAVGVMVGIQDVATEIMDEPGDARHDALAVLAMNQQHDRLGVVRHPGHRRAGLTDLGMVLSSGCQWERKTRVRLLSPRKGVNRKDLKRCVVSQAAARAPLRDLLEATPDPVSPRTSPQPESPRSSLAAQPDSGPLPDGKVKT